MASMNGRLDLDDVPAGAGVQNFLLIFMTALAGALLAINLLPAIIPALAASVDGSEPKVFWLLSRGSAFAAFWLLWLSMAFGLIITNKMAQIWPGIPPSYELHQYVSLLGLGFALFHALILMGDRFIQYTLGQVLVPFGSVNYEQTWVGIGQVGFYVWAVVALSFYVRKRIGKKAWRAIHFASFGVFAGVLAHGIQSGTDSAEPWAAALYWFAGSSLLFLTVYRVLIGSYEAAQKRKLAAEREQKLKRAERPGERPAPVGATGVGQVRPAHTGGHGQSTQPVAAHPASRQPGTRT